MKPKSDKENTKLSRGNRAEGGRASRRPRPWSSIRSGGDKILWRRRARALTRRSKTNTRPSGVEKKGNRCAWRDFGEFLVWRGEGSRPYICRRTRKPTAMRERRGIGVARRREKRRKRRPPTTTRTTQSVRRKARRSSRRESYDDDDRFRRRHKN